MNTLFLNFSTIDRETIVLPCQKIEVTDTVVVVKSLMADNPKILLLEIKHDHINTLLDLTNVAPYELWYFDQQQIFIAKNFSLQNSAAPFQIQTQARYVALIPIKDEKVNKTNLLTDFKCHSIKITDEDAFVLNTFLPGYGIFPYVILKTGHALFMQIPIHINKNYDLVKFPGTNITGVSKEVQKDAERFRDLLIEHTQKMKTKIENDKKIQAQLCLVINASECHYFNNDSIKKSDMIPSGGTLVTQGNRVMTMNREHYIEI
jgi:hypothetical protein